MCRACYLKRCKTPEYHAKLSLAGIGKKSYKRTPKHRQYMSDAMKGNKNCLGRKDSDETRAKKSNAWTPEMRKAAKERGLRNAADAGWRQRIAESVSGPKNPMWQGGISKTKYAPGFSHKKKQEIRERDNNTCQLCGITANELSYTLSIHHIDYDKTNHDASNLASVCKRCNSLANTNRHLWFGYFVALADMRDKLDKKY